MAVDSPVRLFIGSGEASLLERKTLIYSLREHTQRELDIYVFNGTHNAVEHNDEAPVPAPLSLRLKYRNVTEFSNYRFLIPQICGFQGRAIYLDSDMVCLHDIGDLFDQPLDGSDFLAKKEAYAGSDRWGLSVMLIDCGRCRFDQEAIFGEIDQGLYTFEEFHQMAPVFLQRHPYRIGGLDSNWNMFDYHDSTTKLIHYTALLTQPWKFPRHPYGELWFRYFRQAIEAGVVTSRDIQLSKIRGYVRQDIMDGNDPRPHVGGTGASSWRRRLIRHAERLMGRAS
jgi:hypothetical protein